MAHETVKLLANDDLAMIPIRLYLQGVSYLQNCNYDGAVDLCYEFFTQVKIFLRKFFPRIFFRIFFSEFFFWKFFFQKSIVVSKLTVNLLGICTL